MKQELRLGPPSITVEYPHNLDGRKPYRPNFVDLLADIKYKVNLATEIAQERADTNKVRFYILLGAMGINAILQYWF